MSQAAAFEGYGGMRQSNLNGGLTGMNANGAVRGQEEV